MNIFTTYLRNIIANSESLMRLADNETQASETK